MSGRLIEEAGSIYYSAQMHEVLRNPNLRIQGYLTYKKPPLGLYSRTMPGLLWRSWGHRSLGMVLL